MHRIALFPANVDEQTTNFCIFHSISLFNVGCRMVVRKSALTHGEQAR